MEEDKKKSPVTFGENDDNIGEEVPIYNHQTKHFVSTIFKDMNDSLSVDFIQVPLTCVYTHKRIDVPCRTNHCQHIQCFDASAFFQKSRLSASKWPCPICGVKSVSIYIDGYIRSVLQQTSSEDIQIYADCTWEPVKDLEESNTNKDGSDDVIDLTNLNETIIDLTELDVTIDEIDKTLESANDAECVTS